MTDFRQQERIERKITNPATDCSAEATQSMGEWTAERLSALLPNVNEETRKLLADAITAALESVKRESAKEIAAERERVVAAFAVDAANAEEVIKNLQENADLAIQIERQTIHQLREQLNAERETAARDVANATQEIIRLSDQLASERDKVDSLQSQVSTGREIYQQLEQQLAAEKKEYAAWRITVNEEHREQLAAERELVHDAVRMQGELRKQLAAEQEKVENLHEILGRKRTAIQQQKTEIKLLQQANSVMLEISDKLVVEREKVDRDALEVTLAFHAMRSEMVALDTLLHAQHNRRHTVQKPPLDLSPTEPLDPETRAEIDATP